MMKFLNKKRKVLGNKGFSLVELIIVIAIMAVLMAVLAPQLIKYVEKSRTQADDTAAAEILNAVNVAITDDAIYSNLDTGDTVVWNGTATPPTLTNTGDADIDGALATVITDIPEIKSQTHSADDNDIYTITINIDDDGNVSTVGDWG
jgi:type IV pilus assembly protein PilA